MEGVNGKLRCDPLAPASLLRHLADVVAAERLTR